MVENFGEMNLEEQASSLSARGCLWLAVGGRQACKVTHNRAGPQLHSTKSPTIKGSQSPPCTGAALLL